MTPPFATGRGSATATAVTASGSRRPCAAYAVTGIRPDVFSPESAALLHPVLDRHYAVTGGFLVSTQDGIVCSDGMKAC